MVWGIRLWYTGIRDGNDNGGEQGMRFGLGCDHRGLNLKRAISKLVAEMGHTCEDFGCYRAAAVDYPDVAARVAEAVAGGRLDRGILVCSTGIGMSIAANKVKGIRAALCHDLFSARRAREHNDANILCLGEQVVGPGVAEEIVRAFVGAEFQGGRHGRRLEQVHALEGRG